MNNLPLTEERQNLFKSILYVLKSLRKKADEYINTFDQKDFFVFSNEDTQKKHYQSKYCSFTVSIADDLLSLDRLMGNLSSLLLKSDHEMNIDEMILLNNVFDTYINFKKSSSDFFSQADKIFSSKRISISTLLDSAKKFKFDISSIAEKVS